jgi:hypothetical protein
VAFNEFGGILKITLPSDFSQVCITGFEPLTSRQAIADRLSSFDSRIDTARIRIVLSPKGKEMKVFVRMDDPDFAISLSQKINEGGHSLNAQPVSIPKASNCRKLHVSWYKSTRTVSFNCASNEAATTITRKITEAKDRRIVGDVTCSVSRRLHQTKRGTYETSYRMSLSGVPSKTTEPQMRSVLLSQDIQPGRLDMGTLSYRATRYGVSQSIRSLLEEYGALESFYFNPNTSGKRLKAVALFRDEADAKSASVLNGKTLEIIGNGKVTVTLVHSTKLKIQSRIFTASTGRFEEEARVLRSKHLSVHFYPDRSASFTTLKVEGESADDVAEAHTNFNTIAKGVVIRDDTAEVWHPMFGTKGIGYAKLKSLEKIHEVVIIIDKRRRKLIFHGPEGRLPDVMERIKAVIDEGTFSRHELKLDDQQFTRMIRGDFKHFEETLGKHVAVFDVVSRTIVIEGTEDQYRKALKLVSNNSEFPSPDAMDELPSLEGDCPICLCEADDPLRASCGHIYCLECFQDYCTSASSTTNQHFQIACPGSGGTCQAVFKLQELQDRLATETFEILLHQSFEAHVQRHPEAFHYCPTPNCEFVYRCAPKDTTYPRQYECPNCFESVCPACHANHRGYSCAEYRDIKSGGYEALRKLKAELNIKDCPRCNTAIEKTEGCNHMECGGCKTHICWVCMATFETGKLCYDHMSRDHGGFYVG